MHMRTVAMSHCANCPLFACGACLDCRPKLRERAKLRERYLPMVPDVAYKAAVVATNIKTVITTNKATFIATIVTTNITTIITTNIATVLTTNITPHTTAD